MRISFTEAKAALRAGREASSIAENPHGPPPNHTNAGWSSKARALNRVWLRGFFRATKRCPWCGALVPERDDCPRPADYCSH